MSNEAAFLSAIRQETIQRFKLERSTKISNSNRFATYLLFKSVHQAEKYVNDITIKKFRDTLIRLRLGINELGVKKTNNKTTNKQNKTKTKNASNLKMQQRRVLSAQVSWKTKFSSCLYVLFMLESDINT